MARVEIKEFNLDGVIYRIERSDTMTGDRILHRIADSTQGIIESVTDYETSSSELVDLSTVDAADMEWDDQPYEFAPEETSGCYTGCHGVDDSDCHPDGCRNCNFRVTE